jgi:hypothetical protein
MSKRNDDEQFSDKEAAQRRDEVIKRMLNTPPQPRTGKQDSTKAGKATQNPRSRGKRG